MFVFPALFSRWCSSIHILRLHFTPLLLFELLLFTFLLLSSFLSLLMDSCMLIHSIAQLTHFLACFLSSWCICAKCCCRLVLLALVLLGPISALNGAFSECYGSMIAGNHVELQLQEQQQASNESDKQWRNRSTGNFCWDSLQCNLCEDSSHIYYWMLISW